MASNEGSSSSKGSDKKKSSTSNHPAITHPTPFGFMPKLPGEDDKVDWVRTTIEVKAYLKRFVGFVKVLLEPQPVDPNERAAHAESMGQALCDHALVDPDQYPSTLWGMLEVRFTQAPRLSQRNWTFQIVTQ